MLEQLHIKSLFENVTEGIVLTNGEGKIVLTNPAAERMFGYDPGELKGRAVEVLIPAGFRKSHEKLRHGFHQQPSNRAMGAGRDLFALRKDGIEFPVEISLSHYRYEGELFVIAFIVDITQRKKIEQNLLNKQQELERVTHEIRRMNAELEQKVDERTHILKEALEKLEHSQKELHAALEKERQLNEIKSRFVSMASHEFRTPLSAVLSSAALIAKYTSEEDQDKRAKHINRIKESVKHLNDILEDFLSLGRLNEGRIAADPSSFNLRDLLNEIQSDMREILKPDQRFNFHYEGPETAYADKKLLRNIVINLISNAAKFSAEGSPIDVFARINDAGASIVIKDYGIGIPEKDQPGLFSSFFRASNVTNIQGTGLGLHIVKRYTDLMQGTVNLQSKPGKGTTVTIQFPCKINTT